MNENRTIPNVTDHQKDLIVPETSCNSVHATAATGYPRYFMLRWPLSFLFVVLLGLMSGRGRAQPASPDSEAVDAAEESEEDKAAAVEKFRRAQELYRDGQFDEAIPLLLELRAVRREPVLLYNLARAYEGQGELQKARDAYRQYLREAPDAGDRGAIEKRLRTIDEQLEQLKRRPDPAPPPEDDPLPIALSLTMVSVGVAALGVGMGLGLLSGSTADDAEIEPSQVEAKSLHDDATTQATAANVLFVVGGVLVAAGATWLIVELAVSDDVRVSLWPGGVAGRF